MAGYYNKNKDYSLAIKQAQDRGASRSEINQLRQERQNKIDAQYQGRDPYRGSSDIMGNRGGGSSGSGGYGGSTYVPSRPSGGSRPSYSSTSLGNRYRDNDTLLNGGTLYHQGRPSVHLSDRPWQPGMDYAAQAQHYADIGDWDAVDDVLMRRQAKIDDQGGNDRGLSNLELWNALRGSHGFDVVTPSQRPDRRPRPSGGGGYRPGGSYDADYGPDFYLQNLYVQRQAEAEARLRAQFEQDAADIRAHYDAMDDLYDQLRNQQAAQNELERMRMNELGVANGLNTGTFGQLALGQSSAYQKAFADIGRQEAQQKAEQDWKLRQLESAYRGAVEESRARGEAELMDRLYDEFVRQMEVQEQQRREELDRQDREDRYQQQLQSQQQRAALERAKTLAAHGDFSGYAALGYSQEEIAAMRKEWERTHLLNKR